MFNKLILLVVFLFLSFEVLSGDAPMWTTSHVKKNNNQHSYTAAMHNRFTSISGDYKLGGALYFKGVLDSFGFDEAVNYEQEVVVCNASNKTFTEMVEDAYNQSKVLPFSVNYLPSVFGVRDDSTTATLSPVAFDDNVKNALIINANTPSKGRFCYDESDRNGRVSYRSAGAEKALYCTKGFVLPTFFDTASGNSCTLTLDINLKVGETRFIRQPQGSNYITIGQGFVGCYQNANGYGQPFVELVQNPSTCTKENRGACNHTCEWAKNVMCDPVDMPRWGNGMCGGIATMLFRGDNSTVSSSIALSYDKVTGKTYSGVANMSCKMISGKAQWIVGTSNCNITP